MKEKNKISIITATIPAIATLIVGFWGGQAITQNNYKQLIKNSTTVTINEGESTGQVLNRLFDKVEKLEEEKLQIETKAQLYEQTIEELNKELADLPKESNAISEKYSQLQKDMAIVEKERDTYKQKLEDELDIVVPSKDGVPVASLDVFNNQESVLWQVNSGGMQDTLNKDYSGTSSYMIAGNIGYYGLGEAEYFIDGKYTKLEGNIAAHSSSTTDDTSTIQIWGDSKLLWESKPVGIRTDRFSFVLDKDKMDGVRFLKIIQCGSDSIKILLTDWTLY